MVALTSISEEDRQNLWVLESNDAILQYNIRYNLIFPKFLITQVLKFLLFTKLQW